MTDLKRNPLIILDFGSQYTQLIGRRLREMGVYCEIYPFEVSGADLEARHPCGFILSGGPSTTTYHTYPRVPPWVFQSELPVLGICYGMQVMAVQLGGEVIASKTREYGYAEIHIHPNNRLLKQIEDRIASNGESLLDVWMSHGDSVQTVPKGFQSICKTTQVPIAGMAHEQYPWYGLQFHPEVTHTPQGHQILKKFALEICRAETNWTASNIIEQAVTDIRNTVGQDKVLLALSGGVDSSVVAALLHRAIGSQLTCVFVDTGLLRLKEAEQVMEMFGEHMGIRIRFREAEDKFLTALKGITCPEQKRKMIGRTFIEVFEEEANQLQDITWLAQGTIYPDVIESAATGQGMASEVIKSHHNVGGLPDIMNLKLLEPLRMLFKDEVRQVGLALGLPYDMVYRHPFPGPGLAVRILGEVSKAYADILREADAIFITLLQEAGLYHTVSQAFAVFLPVKSVGVMGDGRSYDYVICLRAVETIDFMTAIWAQLPWDFLSKVSSRIINEVTGVSRVTYDISGKPPATIEWE